MTSADSPHETYRERLDRRKVLLLLAEQRDRRFSIVRAVVAVVGLLSWALFGLAGLAVGGMVFFALVIAHERTVRDRERASRRVAFYTSALARLDDDWAGRGDAGQRFLDPAHPYAADLDLFGRGSLFERLCSARTRTGQETLAGWLLSPSSIDVIRERQRGVAELRAQLDLREDLAVLGGEARGAVDSAALRVWVDAAIAPIPDGLRWAAAAASAIVCAGLVRWLVLGEGTSLFFAGLFGVMAAARAGRVFTKQILSGIERPARDLDTLAEIFARLEAERFETTRLSHLRALFGEGERRTSRQVARLRRLVELLESKRNPFFAPFAFLLLWDLHVAAGIESWRRHAGPALGRALPALGEMEALCAVAAYAFENPDDTFASFVEDGPRYEAQEMGHPLLPNVRGVRNDVRMDGQCRLLVVSGSNMSGKSTFLRAIGTNAVLAQAGAPVRARALTLSPVAVGASIRIEDSLQEGRSRFYAEITRVRQIMDLAPGRPWLLFLLDEIFHGTNSADRRVGAEAVVRALVKHGAIGLVTSHDLALAEIADDLAPLAANVHFEDHLEGDRMAFDYRLKAGPVRKSNALGLMRAVGLEV
jgi:hypothetical protein